MPLLRTVQVAPHDPAWFAAAAAEGERISRALGDNVLCVHHIGSTSIPGIFAKPIIDLLPVVRSVDALAATNSAMEALGYECMGEFGIEGRRYYRRDDAAGQRMHNVHAFAEGSPGLERHLAFRDYMIAHPGDAAAYSELKRTLAAKHPTDIHAYMDGKNAFIKEMEACALHWVSRR